jgi:hypothetical protein
MPFHRLSNAFVGTGAVVLLALGIAACDADPLTDASVPTTLSCDLDTQFIADGGVGRDGIPALSNPTFLPALPAASQIEYLQGNDRIIAVWVDDEWLVIPHAIMYRHEIVNLAEITVTYCPLTGTALGFSREAIGGAELGVSGLLYRANLMLYDRTGPDASLWPQMLAQARCGPKTGQSLDRVPVVESRYEEWLEQHPDSKVLAIVPGMRTPGEYMTNPYGDSYESPTNGNFLGFPMPPADGRLLPKDRVLGIPDAPGGPLAFDFRTMRERGTTGVFDFEYVGGSAVVIWDDPAESAAAYLAEVNGQPTTFSNTAQGVVDDLTGTVWSTAGTPLSGALVGSTTRLEAVASAYVSFWRPWAAYHPTTELVLGQ